MCYVFPFDFSFFFFQAEDGIRDPLVTGVQTCALPIFRVPALLERVGLADRAREPISRFSKGMVQRLGIAQALLGDPDLLVLDEPSEEIGRASCRERV